MKTRRVCARLDCAWQVDADTRNEAQAELALHAADTGHWLCCICSRSLPYLDSYTCLGCIGRTKRRLRDIVDLYALLPAELRHHRTINESRSVTDNGALDILVMLGPGSNGGVHPTPSALGDLVTDQPYPYGAPGRRRLPRRPTGVEVDVPFGPLLDGQTRHPLPTGAGWAAVEEHAYWHSDSHGLNLHTDPESIWQTLSQWEDDWRRLRAQRPQLNTFETLAGIVDYLTRLTDWAGNNHPDFPSFVEDLRRIHRALEDAAAHGDRPERSDAPCFRCGNRDLERAYRPAVPCPHPPDPYPELDIPWAPPAGTIRQWIIDWRATHECDQGGRTEVWACRTCGRVYPPKEYWLALRATYEAQE